MPVEDYQGAKYRCDICWEYWPIGEIQEDYEGHWVCPKCLDEQGFNELKDVSGQEPVEHYFRS